MKPFEFQQWHAWESNGNIMLSNEETKELRQFDSVDDCINWLWLNLFRPAARELNLHKKAN